MRSLALKLWHTIDSSNEKSQLRLLLGGSVLVILFLLVLGRFRISTVPVDTDTYFSAGEVFFGGDIDQARTPVYPIVCHLATFAGSACMYLIALLQSIVFLFSVKWFYKTSRLVFSGHDIVAFTVAALYAWNIAVVQHVLSIMTESLSLSCVVLMFLFIVRGIKQQFTTGDAVKLMTLYLVMLFLRPFFICFAPILVVFFLYVMKHSCRGAKLAFVAGLVVVCGAYLGYSAAFKARYGVFTTSSVPDINLNAQLYEAGLLDEPLYKADTIIMERDHARNLEVLSQNRGAWFKHMVSESFMSARQLFPKIILSSGGKLAQPFSLQISAGMLYLITFIFGVVIWVRWRRKKADVRIESLMLATIVVTVVTSVWGAFGVYTRLMLPCYTALCTALGYLFVLIKVK